MYKVYLEGYAVGVSKDFDNEDDAIDFLRILLTTNEAVDNSVCIFKYEEE